MKETTRATYATYARVYTRPYQKTGTGKLKLNGNLYGTGCSVHRPFNYRSPPVFLNGRVRCTDRTGKLFFDAYCTYVPPLPGPQTGRYIAKIASGGNQGNQTRNRQVLSEIYRVGVGRKEGREWKTVEMERTVQRNGTKWTVLRRF